MADRSYSESLRVGLEDAVAFIGGDTSRGRVVEAGIEAAQTGEDAAEKTENGPL